MIEVTSPSFDIAYKGNIIVSPFAVTYEGNDADNHIINAQALGESIIGASKFYNAVAHYCSFGIVPSKKYKKEFSCYASLPQKGSYEYLLYIAGIAQEYNLHNEAYKAAISYLFSHVVNSVKYIWTKKSETEKVVETLVGALKDQAKRNSDIQSQLINAITKSNDNLASLHNKLISTLPQLADATRIHGKQLVTPIGNTCKIIKQFTGTEKEVVIDEPEADAIRSNNETEVEDMQSYTCERITEVNVETGHCILQIEGFDAPLIGKISDPAIEHPNNIYTRALNEKASFIILAKVVKRNGVIFKLYISDAHDS